MNDNTPQKSGDGMETSVAPSREALVSAYGNAERRHASAVYANASPEVIAEWQRKVFDTHAALVAALGVAVPPAPQPVALRYRNEGGRWRYLNYPHTKGWDFPPTLGTPIYLYEGPAPAGVNPSDTKGVNDT